MSVFQNLLIENKGRVQYIIVNRGDKMNALNQSTLVELHTAFELALQNPEVAGIILTGTGTKAFAAGADITEFENIDEKGGLEISMLGHTAFNLIETAGKPVIAAINGYALGGGFELALACHIRIAADTAKLGLPEVSLGLIPGYGGTQRVTLLAGKGKAFEMILTGDMISAADALKWGLVNHVVSPDELLPKAGEILDKILSRSPMAVAKAITAINAAGQTNGFDVEIENFSNCFNSCEMKEGVSAFLQKRKPQF